MDPLKFCSLIILFFTSQTANAFFCPNNFNSIEIGNTIEQVDQACGAPDSQQTTKVEASVPQEWVYYVNPNAGNPDPTLQQSTSMKMTIALNAEKKVVNITVNGQTLITTPICGGSVQVGESDEAVKKACGNPSFINKGEVPSGQAQEIELTEYKYNSNPPVTLIFENKKLKSRK